MAKQVPPIDDDIYAHVQAHAVPLEDDFNSALRRLLGMSLEGQEHVAERSRRRSDDAPSQSMRAARGKPRKGTRARKGSLLPERDYELPILEALVKLGGRAPTSEVVDIVGQALDGRLTDTDREKLASGDLRWRNRAQFVRLSLIKSGDMKGDSPRGMWEITEQGTQRANGASS
jgi:hypothetical protein